MGLWIAFFVFVLFCFGGSGVGIISGQFGDHFRVGDHFGVGIIFGGCTGFPIQTVAAVERCLNLNILLLKRRYLKLINYDPRTAEQCKCEVSIRHFKLILIFLLSLFFLVFSFQSVIFRLSEKRTILA